MRARGLLLLILGIVLFAAGFAMGKAGNVCMVVGVPLAFIGLLLAMRGTSRKWEIVLSVVFFIAFLAVIIIPNMPWVHYPHKEEAALTELHEIREAVVFLMKDNNLNSIPHPEGAATNDMGAFPDAASVAGTTDKPKDPQGNPYRAGDKNGYLLYDHDETGDGSSTNLTKYLNMRYTKGTYAVDAEGKVTQVTTGY